MPKFLVRTLVGISADDPLEAAQEYKHYLATHDPDDLVYRVQNEQTGELNFVFRDQVMTLDELDDYLDWLAKVKEEEDGERT